MYKQMSLNQIIDKAPLAPLVCDKTLNLKAEQIRVIGDVTAATFNGGAVPQQSVTVVPFTIVASDGTERPVVGTGTTGNLTFIKVGRMVTVSLPPFDVSAFTGGGATQALRYKFTSPLPASLVPSHDCNVAFQAQSGTVVSASACRAELSATLPHVQLHSDYGSTGFTVHCGVERTFWISYTTA